jgi:hypothetical chaperone protein
MHEERLNAGRRRSLSAILAGFLAELKARAEAATGLRFDAVLSGRPVHFHSRDPGRDAQAEADLAACYRAAGFAGVRFRYEPEAAALATGTGGEAGGIGLIADIGGGTSDFSVFRRSAEGPKVLASHGLRLGGTDFDHALSFARVMPLFGQGGELRREFGPGLLPVPNALYSDLARWEKIAFLYTPEVLREVRAMAALAVDPAAFARLTTVLRDQLGHDVAFAVERGKIAANAGGASEIGLGLVEPGLAAPLDREGLDAALAGFDGRLARTAAETLALAGIAPEAVGTVILVGGSSLMALVTREMQSACPAARLARADAFTAVVDGLALATGQ